MKSEKVNCQSLTAGALVLLATLLGATVPAQTPPTRPAPTSSGQPEPSGVRPVGSLPGGSGANVIVAETGDYHLSASDVIEVLIEDAPELSGNYRVNKSGSIPMKYLGAIQVAGKTTEDVTTIIADGLRGRYLRDPKVYISVRQYNSRTFFIQGAVRSPGVYVIEGRPSLFKLISIAGGLVENHGSTAYIIREAKSSPEGLERERPGLPSTATAKTGGALPPSIGPALVESGRGGGAIEGESEFEMVTTQISGLYRGNFEQNVIIMPNDLVYIPPADVFFVAGEVKAPGQFRLREGTTVRQAISLAQGTSFRAATDRALIFRQDTRTGKLNEIPLDVGAIMNGRKDDVAILPNDVIMIPNSKVRSVAGAMMMSLGLGVAQTAAWTIFR